MTRHTFDSFTGKCVYCGVPGSLVRWLIILRAVTENSCPGLPISMTLRPKRASALTTTPKRRKGRK